MATANMHKIVRTITHILALAAVLSLVACGPSKSAVNGEHATETATDATAEAEISDGYEGDGMKIPLDGSSVAAFEASMAKVKRNTTEQRYETLEKAVDYLLAYDLGAQGKKALLVERLNGLNGYEVIARTGWGK